MTRPRKTFILELTKLQCQETLRALEWNSWTPDKDEKTVWENAHGKLRQAYTAAIHYESVLARLTEGQARCVLAALKEWGKVHPSTGAWRKAHEKVRKALDLWEERQPIAQKG
jgi:hypothetical protein